MASESPNRTPNGIVVVLGSAAAFVVIAAIFAGALAKKKPGNEVEQKRAAQRVEARTKLETDALEKLNSEGWVDKAKGIVHVSIAEAMTLIVADLSAKKPAPSSVKVEAPLPMPVIDPNATESTPAALPSAPQGADTIRFAMPAAPVPAVAPAAPAPVKPVEPVPVPAAPAPEKPAEPADAAAGKPPLPVAPAKPVDPAPEKPADPAPAKPTENPEPAK